MAPDRTAPDRPGPTLRSGISRPFDERGLFSLHLFEGLGDDARAAMSADIDYLTVSSGVTVIERGDCETDVYVVLSGYLLGVMVSDSGREVAVADFAAGSVFGEMGAIAPEPGQLSIQAAAPCVIARIRRRAFANWIDTYPGVARNLIRILSQRSRAMTEAVFGLVVHRVEVRVRLMLTRLFMERQQLVHGGVLDPAPSHSVIAAHVGANREAVSRVLSALAKRGVLRTGRRRIELVDPDRLREGL